MIHVHTPGRLTRRSITQVSGTIDPPAHGVIEDEDAVGARDGLDESLGLRIIDALDLLVVVEILDRAFLQYKRKSLPVERHRLGDGTNIVDRKSVRLGRRVRPRLPWRRLESIGARPVSLRGKIVQIGGDKRQRLDLFVLQSHFFLLPVFRYSVSVLDGSLFGRRSSPHGADAVAICVSAMAMANFLSAELIRRRRRQN